MLFNVYRLSGDALHLTSFLFLLTKLYSTRSCRGISLKTQELRTLVFVCRYADLLWTSSLNIYNTCFKVTYLALSATILGSMRLHPAIRATYERDKDLARHHLLLLPCLALAALVHNSFTPFEVAWAFSMYLEAIAILPQLLLLQQTPPPVDPWSRHYVAMLGLYRLLYIANWVHRWLEEPYYGLSCSRCIDWAAGAVCVLLYADFFVFYVGSCCSAKAMAFRPCWAPLLPMLGLPAGPAAATRGGDEEAGAGGLQEPLLPLGQAGQSQAPVG